MPVIKVGLNFGGRWHLLISKRYSRQLHLKQPDMIYIILPDCVSYKKGNKDNTIKHTLRSSNNISPFSLLQPFRIDYCR